MGRFGDKKSKTCYLCCASGVWPGVGCLGLTVLAFAYVKFTILENDATSHSFVTNVESFYITMVSVNILNLQIFIYEKLCMKL